MSCLTRWSDRAKIDKNVSLQKHSRGIAKTKIGEIFQNHTIAPHRSSTYFITIAGPDDPKILRSPYGCQKHPSFSSLHTSRSMNLLHTHDSLVHQHTLSVTQRSSKRGRDFPASQRHVTKRTCKIH